MHQSIQLIILWLLFSIPTASQPNPFFNTRTRAVLQIAGGTAVVSMAGYIVKNIVSTATRRLSNPEFKNNRSLATVLRQTLVIFAHNKLLAASSLAALVVGSSLIYFGIKTLQHKEKIGSKGHAFL